MGWFSTENFITNNNMAVEETRIIAIVLVVLTVILVTFGMFKAYNSHMKAHVKHAATREAVLNNVRAL